MAGPLYSLLTQNVEFEWTPTCEEAFSKLKGALTQALVLKGPNWSLSFHIHTDASDFSIGAVLGQKQGVLENAIYYINKNLQGHELNYTEFDITIIDKPGKANVVVDFLSRIQTQDSPGAIDDSFPDEHLFSINVNILWYVDIANYLAANNIPPYFSLKERRLLVEKSFNFSWIVDCLFYTRLYQVMRRCVSEDETYDILHSSHDKPCGGHFAAKRTTLKILTIGYYWPTLHKDAVKYTRKCDRCQ
ncbi:uncharacterized protein LOC131038479 [Cryptomeria japonica]|uniref:uncharacterized protein LOC131038479 n=1 Tax=Cryptomeria japonica TaxID=3369 RepID=UPI0025ABDD1F|nr:uncharacterized protein LOC131038479 [Cryptomeria japonica]